MKKKKKYMENQAPAFVQEEADILKLFSIFYYGVVQHFPNCFLLDITILIDIIIIFWGGGKQATNHTKYYMLEKN